MKIKIVREEEQSAGFDQKPSTENMVDANEKRRLEQEKIKVETEKNKIAQKKLQLQAEVQDEMNDLKQKEEELNQKLNEDRKGGTIMNKKVQKLLEELGAEAAKPVATEHSEGKPLKVSFSNSSVYTSDSHQQAEEVEAPIIESAVRNILEAFNYDLSKYNPAYLAEETGFVSSASSLLEDESIVPVDVTAGITVDVEPTEEGNNELVIRMPIDPADEVEMDEAGEEVVDEVINETFKDISRLFSTSLTEGQELDIVTDVNVYSNLLEFRIPVESDELTEEQYDELLEEISVLAHIFKRGLTEDQLYPEDHRTRDSLVEAFITMSDEDAEEFVGSLDENGAALFSHLMENYIGLQEGIFGRIGYGLGKTFADPISKLKNNVKSGLNYAGTAVKTGVGNIGKAIPIFGRNLSRNLDAALQTGGAIRKANKNLSNAEKLARKDLFAQGANPKEWESRYKDNNYASKKAKQTGLNKQGGITSDLLAQREIAARKRDEQISLARQNKSGLVSSNYNTKKTEIDQQLASGAITPKQHQKMLKGAYKDSARQAQSETKGAVKAAKGQFQDEKGISGFGKIMSSLNRGRLPQFMMSDEQKQAIQRSKDASFRVSKANQDAYRGYVDGQVASNANVQAAAGAQQQAQQRRQNAFDSNNAVRDAELEQNRMERNKKLSDIETQRQVNNAQIDANRDAQKMALDAESGLKEEFYTRQDLEELFEALELDTHKYTFEYLAEELGFAAAKPVATEHSKGKALKVSFGNSKVYPAEEHEQSQEVEAVIIESLKRKK